MSRPLVSWSRFSRLSTKKRRLTHAHSRTRSYFAAVGDPTATGLARNLARPDGNGTGMSLLSTELGVKRLDLLRQLAPHAKRVASLVALINPSEA